MNFKDVVITSYLINIECSVLYAVEGLNELRFDDGVDGGFMIVMVALSKLI